MIKTGLLFGSFNPVHIGHIAIGEYMKEFEGMEEIWFIVSPQNPLKSPQHLATPASRLQMARLAIKNYPAFRVSDIEFSMPVPSYTVNTMLRLSDDYPERDFHIIIGTDNIMSIRKWKGCRTLLNNYKFLIYPRPGTLNPETDLFRKARLVKAPVIDISSSFIRRALLEGKSTRSLVPAEAYDYILKNRLYSGK